MKQKTRILIYILIAAAVVIVGTIIILMSRNNAGQEKSHLDLGRTYLLDLSYDKAILEFKEAINIDPNDPEPYIELANTYEEIGDIPNAIETLEDGYEKTGDERIKEKLDELQTKENGSEHNEADAIAASETSAVTTTATAVNESEAETSVTVEMATVPDLVGLNEEEAKKLCEDNGLKFTVSYSESNDVEKDIVMSQMIPAGTSVAKGISVPFAVSEGSSVKVELVAENLQFDYLADFEESGWAFAVRGNKGGYVNTSGKFVEVYDDVPTLDNEYLVYWAWDYGIGTIDTDDRYSYWQTPFVVSNEGIYPYYKDGYWGYANINTEKIVVPCQYNFVSAFLCGRGFVGKIVEENGGYYDAWEYNIVDSNGNIISCDVNIDSLRTPCFVNDIAILGSPYNNPVTIIDKNGNVIKDDVQLVHWERAQYLNKIFTYKCNESLYDSNNTIWETVFIGENGKQLCSVAGQYFVYSINDNGLALCQPRSGDLYVVIDCNNGGIIVSKYDTNEYNWYNPQFSDQYIARGKGENDSWTLFDLNGNKIFKNEYEFVSNPSFDIISVKKNGKFGFVDINENLVIDYIFNDVYFFDINDGNLIALCENNNGPCLINKKGNVIYQYTGTLEYYDDIGDYTYIIIKSNGKYSIYKISMR